MSKRIYKSAQGKTVDLGALILQNENTRAVGNMKANARGDIIDSAGQVISSRSQQINRALNKQVSGTISPVAKGQRREPAVADAPVVKAPAQPETVTGLAAALARAEQLKDQDE